jgi:methyl-accepting chemotaxis protein
MDQRTHFPSLAEAAIRGSATMIEMQIGLARQVIGLQAKSAAAFGLPDYSEALNASIDGSRRLVGLTTDQLLATTQRISETMGGLQSHFAHLAEEQARIVTEEMCRGLDRFSQGTDQALKQVSKGAEEVARAAEGKRKENVPLR